MKILFFWILMWMLFCCAVQWLTDLLWNSLSPTLPTSFIYLTCLTLETPDNFIQLSFHEKAGGPKSYKDCLAQKRRASQRQSQGSWKSSLLFHQAAPFFAFRCIPPAHTRLTMPAVIFWFDNTSKVMFRSDQNRVFTSYSIPWGCCSLTSLPHQSTRHTVSEAVQLVLWSCAHGFSAHHL